MATKKTPQKTNNKSTSKKTNAAIQEEFGKGRISYSVKNKIAGILIIAIGIFLIVAMSTSASGVIGEIISDVLKGVFGFGAFILPFFLMIYGVLVLAGITSNFRIRTIVLLIVVFFMIDILNGVRFLDDGKYSILNLSNVYANGISLTGGGVFGTYVGTTLIKGIGIYGTYLFVIIVMVICMLLLLDTPISRFLDGRATKKKAKKEKEEYMKQVIEKEEEVLQKEREKRWAEEALSIAREEIENPKKKNAFIIANPFDKTRPNAEPARYEEVPTDEEIMPDNTAEIKKPRFLHRKSEKDNSIEPVVLEHEKIPNILDRDPKETMENFGFEDTDSKNNNFVNSNQIKNNENIENSNVEEDLNKKDKNDEDEIITKKTQLEELDIDTTKHVSQYKLPPQEILDKSKVRRKTGISEATKDRAILLETTLSNFGVNAKVVNVTEGPAITRYEIQPALGVKVSSIVRLQDDIALNLKAKTMRIEAPIPGKAAVGIEIENGTREMVTLGDMVTTKEFKNHPSKISFAVGRDIEGNSIVADMKKMPHLLIAGATGAGKSVCINTIIASILYKASPEEVRLVLIDPKMVELGNYNGIPHLLIPVVIDPKKAAAALNWAVGEMTERYKKFAETGTKNLESYNDKMKKNGELDKVMPQIVIVIDELADLMMVASSVVEDAICRLAQMARAAGMHLIVATQRPSVDVITGLIKANVPSRIAFMVSSQIDSRTIIDMAGAEKLVGNGDMLFKTGDTIKPVRIQCPFISEREIKDLIDFITENNNEESNYETEIIEKIENGGGDSPVSDIENQSDELLEDSALAVISAGQASVSMLQRRFRIGYNRAARIIDELEALGVIGASEGSKPRQVILNQLEWDNLKNGNSEDKDSDNTGNSFEEASDDSNDEEENF